MEYPTSHPTGKYRWLVGFSMVYHEKVLHTNFIFKKYKTSTVILSIYRNPSGSLGEREMLWEHEPQASVSTAFWSSPKLSRVYKSIETQQTCFLFLLESTAAKKRKTSSLLWSSKCKFSLLAPSLRQQLVPVLCLHRVIETRILTNQRAYFVRAVF